MNYYDLNAEEFCNNTIDVNMGCLYTEFLNELVPNGKILDAGCGSGRDSLYFIKNGYKVVAFDSSAEMVKRSSELVGIKVKKMTFNNANFNEQFDGVWACASLLHINKRNIVESISKIIKYLKQNGIFYMSFKYGTEEYEYGGRFFNCYDETLFKNMIGYVPQLKIIKIFKTTSVNGQIWLNCLLKKQQ